MAPYLGPNDPHGKKTTKKKKKVAPKLQAVPRGAGGFAVKAPSVGAKPKGWLD